VWTQLVGAALVALSTAPLADFENKKVYPQEDGFRVSRHGAVSNALSLVVMQNIKRLEPPVHDDELGLPTSEGN
jgi:hypothetical protein